MIDPINWAIDRSNISPLFATVCTVRYFKRRPQRHIFGAQLVPNGKWEYDPDRSLAEQILELPYNLHYEFPRLDVSLIKIIGKLLEKEYQTPWVMNLYFQQWVMRYFHCLCRSYLLRGFDCKVADCTHMRRQIQYCRRKRFYTHIFSTFPLNFE